VNNAFLYIWRILKTAEHALRRNFMRSMLTCLGIIIGIAAVIAMVELGQGSSFAIQQTIAKLGANKIQLDPDSSNLGGVSSGSGGQATLSPEDCDAIIRECDAVRWAAPSVDTWSQLVYGSQNWWPMRILGSTPEYLQVCDWLPMKEGACFTDEDVQRASSVCVIGTTIEKQLFGDESPLGKEIRVRNVRLVVVGVLASKGSDMQGRDQDDFLLAPWTTIKYRLSGNRSGSQSRNTAAVTVAANTLSQIYPNSSVALYPTQSATQVQDLPQLVRFADMDDVWISAVSPDKVSTAMEQITSLLKDRHNIHPGQPPDFRLRDMTQMAEGLASTSTLMTNLLLSVALISLVVGGVGIMNIMLVSVTERTKEIGLRMAVGARGVDILLQFLVEAVMMCLTGGVIGIAMGRGTSWMITHFLGWPTRLSIVAIVVATLVSAIVGVVFGFYPAWKASRLDPIEALRYE
jgi:ABC-type antimicrobial peptide transport system permease subunit